MSPTKNGEEPLSSPACGFSCGFPSTSLRILRVRLGSHGRARQIHPQAYECALFAYSYLLARETESVADFRQRTGVRFPESKAQAEDVGFRLWEAGECPIQVCSAL